VTVFEVYHTALSSAKSNYTKKIKIYSRLTATC